MPIPIIEHLNLTYEDAGPLLVDIRRPDVVSPTPLVVYAHGGGFTSGARNDPPDIELMEAITGAGFATASIDYNYLPEFSMPVQLHDFYGAIRWLRANAATYNIDKTSVGVCGVSAGSILAAMALTLQDVLGIGGVIGDPAGNPTESISIQAGVFISGVMSELRFGSLRGNDQERIAKLIGATTPFYPDAEPWLAAYMPNRHLSAATPPCLIVQGALDDRLIIAGATDLYWDMLAAGAVVDLVVNDAEGHGLDNGMVAIDAINDFFGVHLVGSGT